MEKLIHEIDVVRWLFGPLDPDAASLQRTTCGEGKSAATILFSHSAEWGFHSCRRKFYLPGVSAGRA